MPKKWMILLSSSLVIIFLLWQVWGAEQLRPKTVVAPDYTPSSIETEKTDEIDLVKAEEKESHNSSTDNDKVAEEKIIFSSEDLVYEIETIGKGLEIPWEIVPMPDGRIIVTQRAGKVVMLGKGEIYTVPGVEQIGEGGLLGIAISQDFEKSGHMFLYYTYKAGNQLFNKVSRFTFEENTLIDELVVLDKIPGSTFHNGGRLKIGPDEKLYITTGDAQNPNLSQDINSLAGKILRINTDGSIPEDNPFKDSLVYAYGFRNPQGLSWHPVSGELFASDHGPNSRDEINLVMPGKNYGWPNATCLVRDNRYEAPVACYSDFTLAPSGIDFLLLDNLSESPLYVAGLRGNMIVRIDLNDEGGLIRQEQLFRDFGRIRTIVCYKDSLYIATNNRDGRGTPKNDDDKIIKITPIFPPIG